MSANIPESNPHTTAHPPSKRQKTTPTSLQSTQITALFSRPHHDPLPSTSSSLSSTPHTPSIVNNVQGSSAGAGSGEFHVYKASRRREYERLRAMDEEVEGERIREEFEREREERERGDEERTRKLREKRARKKRGKGGKEEGEKGEKEKAGIKARVEMSGGKAENGGGGGEVEREGDGVVAVAAEPVGLVIHDDD